MVRGVLKTPGASHETAKKGAGWTPPLRGLASWQLDLKSVQNFFSEQNKSSWIGGFFLANFQVKTHQKFKNGIFGHFDPLFKYFFLARLYFTRPARGGGGGSKVWLGTAGWGKICCGTGNSNSAQKPPCLVHTNLLQTDTTHLFCPPFLVALSLTTKIGVAGEVNSTGNMSGSR